MPRISIAAQRRSEPSNDTIKVVGARENNLKNVTVSIPKKRITVFTGVSGSGKSSLVFDTIAAESQRQLNETFSTFIRNRLPQYGQPAADALENLSAAIVVDQKRIGGNARSTVGTITDINPILRLLYSRIGQPFVGYSNVFSFNDPNGMCPRCEGLGTVATVDVDRLIDKDKSINEGPIRFPTFRVGSVRLKRYALSGLFDNDKKLRDYTPQEWETFLYPEALRLEHPSPGYPLSAMYEGVIHRFSRNYVDVGPGEVKGIYKEAFDRVVTQGPCPKCNGTRLNEAALSSRIDGRNIANLCAIEIRDLIGIVRAIDAPVAQTMVASIVERLEDLVSIGLGYLSLSRETSTLSGGESQRVKMVRHLGSSLTDMTYIFDEPSVGLHPRDVHQLNDLVVRLRDKGNTVLLVEHDPDVIAIADHVIDMGPGAGIHGGEIVYQGDLRGLTRSGTLTGKHLGRRPTLKREPRQRTGVLNIRHAKLHNLQDVSVDIPRGVMTVVTGVAGSGKSTLVNAVLPRIYPEAIRIDQTAIRGSKRSNPATYAGIFDSIRNLFARANQVSAALFSFNSEGACPQCKGLGTVATDLAFMDPIVTICEMCSGSGYTNAVLRLKLRGKNIREVLNLSIDDARDFFAEEEMRPALQRMVDVGLGYVALGQPLSSLSGGERQRIKLATELQNRGQIYVLDEPTTGLHLSDIENLMNLLDRLVDNGSTVIVIEHNLDVIGHADWVIDLGPGAGHDGGRIMFEGPAHELVNDRLSQTGIFLRKYLCRDKEWGHS